MSNEGPTSGPDLRSLIQAAMPQKQGGSGSPVLNAIGLHDADVGAGLSLKGKGLLNADNMIRKPMAQAKPHPFDKLFKDLGLNGADIVEGLKKVAQAAPVQQANIESITGSSHGLGGTAVQSLSTGNDIGHG